MAGMLADILSQHGTCSCRQPWYQHPAPHIDVLGLLTQRCALHTRWLFGCCFRHLGAWMHVLRLVRSKQALCLSVVGR